MSFYEKHVLARGACDNPESVLATVLVLVVIALFAGAIHQANVHEAFLKSHGCQLLTKASTGREVYCGKACFAPEYVYVYECADGTRTEVH